MSTVAVLGLGAMGKGMAARLADWLRSHDSEFQEVLVWNRTAATAAQFAAETPGVTALDCFEHVRDARVVVAMLSNDAAAEEVLGSYLATLGDPNSRSAQPTPVYVNSATILPATVKRLAAAAKAADVRFVNMPVFGRPDAAASGSLVAVFAGPAAAREVLAPLLPAIAGRGVWDLGEDPAKSAALKLIGNFFIVSSIEVASQCLTLAAKNGVEDADVLRMLQTFHSSPIPTGYAQRMSEGDYSTEAGFAVDLALKDVGHMRCLAAASACPLPLADLAYNHLLQAKASHGGQLDWGAIHLAVRQSAGLPSNNKDKLD